MHTIIDTAWQKFFSTNLVSFSKIPLGFKNESYLCEGEDGQFVLKFYAKNFLQDQFIEEQCRVVEAIRAKGIPTPSFQKGKDGKYMQLVTNGNPESYQVTASSYIDGMGTEKPIITKTLIHEVAAFLPKLHLALKDIPSPITQTSQLDLIPKLTNLLSPGAIKTIEKYLHTADYWGGQRKQYIENYMTHGEKIMKHCKKNHQSTEKYQLIHGDFCLGNLNIKGNKINGIFDFDEMVFAPRSFEIACAIVHLDENYLYPEDLFHTCINNYRQYEPLTKEEIEDVIWLMLFRCFYRIGRFFVYYQDKAPEPFVQYERKMRDYERLFETL